MTRNELRVNNSNYIRYSIVAISFILSCINSLILGLWIVAFCLFYTLQYKVEGAIECLLLLTLRGILNPGIAIEMSSISIIKWFAIFLLSFYIMFALNMKIDKIKLLFIFFAVYLSVVGFFVSSYPLVVITKVISYIIPFIAILTGIQSTNEIKWIKRLFYLLSPLMIGSIIVVPFPIAYLINGHAFQGLLNHPNIYGVLWVLFSAMYLYNNSQKISIKSIAFLCFALLNIFLTESRTSLFSLASVILIYIFTLKEPLDSRLLYFSVTVFSFLILILISSSFRVGLMSFIYKGHNNILYSREDLLERNFNRFLQNPFWGTGLNVPYRAGIRSYEFSFDLITENGNIITALLGDLGILGIIIFVLSYGYIWRKGRKNGSNVLIFITPFLVSMGEMVFFSTNNMAIFLYMFFACFLYDDQKQKKETLYENLIYSKHTLTISR